MKITSRRWKKSSFSGHNGDCVEVDNRLSAVRDTKNEGVVLNVPMGAFVGLLKGDRFTGPAV